MPKVAVGGTFQYFHDGHAKLIEKAFKIAEDGKVHIGLTSDEMLHKNHSIDTYENRRKRLLKYIKEMGFPDDRYEVTRLNDPCGPTIEEEFDYIVVSPETYPVALKINRVREEKGKKPLEIVYVEYVMADDGIPISSTRIAKGEIDRHGRLKKNIGTLKQFQPRIILILTSYKSGPNRKVIICPENLRRKILRFLTSLLLKPGES